MRCARTSTSALLRVLPRPSAFPFRNSSRPFANALDLRPSSVTPFCIIDRDSLTSRVLNGITTGSHGDGAGPNARSLAMSSAADTTSENVRLARTTQCPVESDFSARGFATSVDAPAQSVRPPPGFHCSKSCDENRTTGAGPGVFGCLRSHSMSACRYSLSCRRIAARSSDVHDSLTKRPCAQRLRQNRWSLREMNRTTFERGSGGMAFLNREASGSESRNKRFNRPSAARRR
jgi:hypothetical protein